MGELFSKANGVVWVEDSVDVGEGVEDVIVSGFPTPFLGWELTVIDDTSESGLVVISEMGEDVVEGGGGSTCGLLTTGLLADAFGVAKTVEVMTTVVGGMVITGGGGGGSTGKVGVGGVAGVVGLAGAIKVEVEGASCKGGNDCTVGDGVSGGGRARVATGCLCSCSSSSSESESPPLPCLFLVPW